MNGETWTSYELQSAPRNLLCQFRRKDNEHITWQFVGYAKDLHPEFDISGLEWQLTGIAREALDRMPEAVRQQVMMAAPSWWNMMAQSSAGLSG